MLAENFKNGFRRMNSQIVVLPRINLECFTYRKARILMLLLCLKKLQIYLINANIILYISELGFNLVT